MSQQANREWSWRLDSVVEWMFRRGRKIREPAPFLEALASELLRVGAPVWRIRLTLQTLHPQVRGFLLTWTRDTGTTKEVRAPHSIGETSAYRGSPIERIHQTGQPARYDLRSLHPDSHHALKELAAQGGTDYLALPLVFSDERINSLTIATDDALGFSDGDVAAFESLCDYLVPIVESMATHRIAESLLDTYVGPRTGRRILDGLVKRGDGEKITAAIWFSDLRDFTGLSEQLSPSELMRLLNLYFELVAEAVTARSGEILRFIGDAMLVVFPVTAPDDADDTKQACRRAVDAALEAFARARHINRARLQAGEPEIRFGIGLSLGEVLYGNVGAPNRLDFTVIGSAVNQAARTEDLTKALQTPLLMSESLALRLDQPVVDLGRHPMRGFATPQAVFALDPATH